MKRLSPYIYLLSTGHFSVDWCQGAIPALLPYFISSCHLTYQQGATLIFANLLISSVTQPFLGYYSDKISQPWFAPLGSLLSGLGILLLGFTQNYWLIFALSMLCGLGASLYHPEAARMVNNISGMHKGQAMGTFSVGGNAGFAIGPLLAGFCAYTFDIHGLILFGLVNGIIALTLYHYMPQIQLLAQRDQLAEAKAHPNEEKTNHWGAFGRLTVVIFVRSIIFTACNAFIPLYWIHVLQTTPAAGSLALTILFSMGVVITFIGGLLADRFGLVRVLRGALTLMVPAIFLLVNSTNLLAATALLLPVALALFAAYSPIVVLGQTYLAKNVGFASGVTLGLTTTMGGLFSPLIGWGADQWGIQPALQILWVCALIGAIFAFLVPDPKK